MSLLPTNSVLLVNNFECKNKYVFSVCVCDKDREREEREKLDYNGKEYHNMLIIYPITWDCKTNLQLY